MSEKVYVGYYFNKERPLLQFKGQFSEADFVNIFDKNSGLTRYTFAPASTRRNGEISFSVESSKRARDITEKLTPVLEQRGYELVYTHEFF